MAEFIEKPTSLFLTDPEVASAKTPVGSITADQKKRELKYTTDLTKEEIDAFTDSYGKPLQPLTYKNLGTQGLQTRINEGADLTTLTNHADKEAEINKALMGMESLSAVDITTAEDDATTSVMWKTQRRVENLQNRVMDHIEASNGGAVDSVFEFVDMMAYETYAGVAGIKQGITGGGTERTTESIDIATAVRTLSDEEYVIWEQGYLDNMASKGLAENIGGESGWAGLRALQAVEGAGSIVDDEFWGYFNAAVGIADIGSLGLFTASKLAKVGRSTVGKLRNTGTVAATKAAESTDLVLRTGINGEIVDDLAALEAPRPLGIEGPEQAKVVGETPNFKRDQPSGLFGGRAKNMDTIEEAEIIEDIVPEAIASKVKPKETPPVSFSSVRKTWAENTFVNKFLNKEAKHSFGASEIGANARSWAFTEASRLARASQTQVMDFNFVDEGMQSFRTSVTFGRTDGTPFSSFGAAKKAMEEFPNSIIIDLRSNKVVTEAPVMSSGQYAIRSETRVPYTEAVTPMDLEIQAKGLIGSFFDKVHSSRPVRYFASAHYGTSSYLSNLADAAEFGHLGFHKDIEYAFKEINKLGGSDLKAINKILTSLRDAPTQGTPKSWLDRGTFISRFKDLTGKAPTIDQIKAYEHIVEMSDFSWYVMASDRLRAMSGAKASIIEIDGIRHTIYPTERTVASLKSSGRQVWARDFLTGKRVSVNSLDDSQPIMSFGHRQGDYSDYIFNFEGKTKLPTLEDAYAYNAGGPRTNPDLRYFVGDTTHGWATLLGTRTEKEAKLAKTQFNNISTELSRVFGENFDPSALASLTKKERGRLDAFIVANNGWNTSVDTLEKFLVFCKERGVNPTKEIFYKERNAKLATFKELGDGINDPHLLDMSIEKYSAYSRQDIALTEYGGAKVSNPDPIIAVADQFNHMISRAAQTQYRMEATTSWVKAVERAAKNGDIQTPDIPLAPMTDESKVRAYKIKGNTKAAIALRKEQDVIRRRLNMYDGMAPQIGEAFTRFNDSTFEAIWNKNKLGAKAYEKLLGKNLDNASEHLMTLGFYQKIADPANFILQSAHIINIAAISPINGSKAAALATVLRHAARSGEESLWRALEGKVAKLTGLNAEQNKALMEHLLDSGRGYMRGAVAEDVMSSGKKGIFGKIGDIVRIPFYAGENYQATASRITAYLDTVDDFPDLKVGSKEFWNQVQKRDRTLSFGMNSAQKSLAQSGKVSKVITQWTAYPLRAFETLIFGDISGVAKARLAGTTAVLWGMAGLGMYAAGEKIGENLPDWMREMIIDGLGDSLLSETTGVKLGTRIGLNPVALWERAIGSVFEPAKNIPAARIVGDTAFPALQAILHFGTGRIPMASHDVETLARAWKIVDSPIMAYEMMMHDVRTSRTGQITEGPFTTSQELFQFLGLAPDKALDEQRVKQLVFNIKERQSLAYKKLLPYTKEAFEAIKRGDYAAAISLFKDIDCGMGGLGLTPTMCLEVKDDLIKTVGQDQVDNTVKTLLKAGYEELAKDLAEQAQE